MADNDQNKTETTILNQPTKKLVSLDGCHCLNTENDARTYAFAV